MNHADRSQTLSRRLGRFIWGDGNTSSGAVILRQTLLGMALQAVAALVLLVGHVTDILPFDHTTTMIVLLLVVVVMMKFVARVGPDLSGRLQLLWRLVEIIVLLAAAGTLAWGLSLVAGEPI